MRQGQTRVLALSLATDTIGRLDVMARHLGISRSGLADMAITKWLDLLDPDDLPPVDAILPEEMSEMLQRRRKRRAAVVAAELGDQSHA